MPTESPDVRSLSNVEQARAVPLSGIPERREPKSILMCEPTSFKVIDVKNPFMEGNIDRVDTNRAMEQWINVKATFERLGSPVKVVPGHPGLEDMVFTANQVLLGETATKVPYVVMARMVHESRRKEIPHFAKWFASQKYNVLELPAGDDNLIFEGQGDAIWHPGKQLLWGGYGHRTKEAAHDAISALLNVPVVKLRLVNPRFYHLDTCFCPLNEDTVLFYPPAFAEESVKLIKHYFPKAIAVSDKDAHNFACNAVVIGNNVVIQSGSPDACAKLREVGFNPVEVETDEFMKSGGSACCMKMFVY